jgi:hypothetical protein
MKASEIESLEGYFKTENKHWNSYAFEMLCDMLQQGNFDNAETPLQLLDKAISIFTELHETPLKAVQVFAAEADKYQLSPAQRLFVYERVFSYVQVSEFDELDLSEVTGILKSQTERLKASKAQAEYNKPLTGCIRDNLKQLLQKELEQLPGTLKELEPAQRLNVLCKLMPYVLPKVESVTHTQGEPEADTQGNGLKW